MIYSRICWLTKSVLLVLFIAEVESTIWTQPAEPVVRDVVSGPELRDQTAVLWSQVESPTHFTEDFSQRDLAAYGIRERLFRQVLQEKLQNKWFAALVPVDPLEASEEVARFPTWKSLIEFIEKESALVDVWALGEGGGMETARRIPYSELANLKRQIREPPTFVTLTYRDPLTGQARRARVEFGFGAAEVARVANAKYVRHRELQLEARRILGTRDSGGRLNALAQWQALRDAIEEGRFSLAEIPSRPVQQADLFAAVEFEVDDANSYSRIIGFFRESEIKKQIMRDTAGRATQVLILRKAGEKRGRQALGYALRAVSDELLPMPNPISGRDQIELRIKDSGELDPRRWNVLEFGEPEVLKESALGRFALINAHMDRQRKVINLKKSKYDLIAEPLIAGLNVGGGLSGLGFPAGDAGRLFYNLISSQLISDVPTAKELRDLFAILAAKERNPALNIKPTDFLSSEDIKKLSEAGKRLSDAEVQEYLQRVSDTDLKAMVRLGRMGMFDARITNFLNILTSAGKVSGLTDEPGLLRDIFNSPYFSLNGDINLKTILAVAIGQRVLTPLSGTSLESLSRGEGPVKAWAQFFDVSIDVRALANSLVRLSQSTIARKELEKPFPYAYRASDLAAYEVRVFGFPLLLFYKRGLLKEDLNAFDHDYAYGVLGAKLVEHFATRDEMDAEIRAQRMVPLGFVRVLDGKGGWKESNLAVFAHKIPSGKYRGKTAVILYGLKAYEERSAYVERELRRFQEFEKALREGAVIEQLIATEDSQARAPNAFEPIIHVGEHYADQFYAPLLSGLQEMRRYWQFNSWGVSLSPQELDRVATTFEDFAAKGIWLDDADPLIGIDRFNSSFLYRRLENGKRQIVKVTLLPSLAQIQQSLGKSEEAVRIENLRRNAMTESGVVLINTVREVNGQPEMGPLLADATGQVVNTGIRTGSNAVNHVLSKLDGLKAADRARFQFNNFSSTVLDLDLNGDGKSERAFVTIEFPFGQTVQRNATNVWSGEREQLSFEKGRWQRTITSRRIVEPEYDSQGWEIRTRTYFNRGTFDQPSKGALLEETQTLATWFRNLNRPDVDPFAPKISKLRMNYITGQMSREVYGLFSMPTEVADEQFLTRNRFNGWGLFASAKVLDNGIADADFQRPKLERLLRPIAGRERFDLRSTVPGLETLPNLGAHQYQGPVARTDLVKGLSRALTFDHAHFGRIATEQYVDSFDGTRSFGVSLEHTYQDTFLFGAIPFRTDVKSAPGGVTLAELRTVRFDPLLRRLTGVQSDYTGKLSTNMWDYRWESPVITESSLRRTTNEFNRYETSVTGATFSRPEGETLSTFNGQFQAGTKTWELNRSLWHRSGVLVRVETNTLSGFGKLIATRAGGLLETRPIYSPDGIETSRRTTRWNAATGQFDLVHRTEDDFRWAAGGRDARVQTYVDGRLHDQFRNVSDAEGRTVTNAIKELPNLSLKTVVSYDGATERILKSEDFQNGQLRLTRWLQAAQALPNGTYHLSQRLQPYWGLMATQSWVLADVLARPTETIFENGDRAVVREWFDGTSVPKISESSDRTGRVKERWMTSTNWDTREAYPIDWITRYKVDPWGGQGLTEERAVIRGTDLMLFKEAGGERTYFDLNKPYAAPSYAIDPKHQLGQRMVMNQVHANVLAWFQCDAPAPGSTAIDEKEPLLTMQIVDLRNRFYLNSLHRKIDRVGNILEETEARSPVLGDKFHTVPSITQAIAQAGPASIRNFRYQPGWLVEESDPATSGKQLAYVDRLAAGASGISVNEGPWREMVSQIDVTEFAASDLTRVGAPPHLAQRVHRPIARQRNPHFPERADIWTSWTTSELRPDGSKLFDTETIYDAQGRPSVARSFKRTATGIPASKVSYYLPPPMPGALKESILEKGEQSLPFDVGGLRDLSGSDFVYFYLQEDTNITWQVVFSDQARRKVNVGSGAPANGVAVSTWMMNSANPRWLPNRITPQYGLTLNASDPLPQREKLNAISVHDLAFAGLDIRHLQSASLLVRCRDKASLRVSSLYQLSRNGKFVKDEQTEQLWQSELTHSSGLRTFTKAQMRRTDRERFSGQRMSSIVDFGGFTVAVTQDRGPKFPYPPLIVLDTSDPQAPRPMYAVSSKDGHLLEHYFMRNLGDIQVYTIVQGFDLPRFEVFDATVLEDENAAGFIAYGYDYHVTVKHAKGSGLIGGTLANLHDRIVGNAFKIGSDQVFGWFSPDDTKLSLLERYNYRLLHDAKLQANAVKEHTMLAQGILQSREVPWKNVSVARQKLALDRNEFATNLLALQVRSFNTNTTPTAEATYLIPTAPGTSVERYVDTVKEAGLIKLAININEFGLARELLDFYWKKSQGGQRTLPLHASYDARAGTSLAPDFLFDHPPHARWTAAAQIEMAEAALSLGVRTGEAKWLTMGRNLMTNLLAEFRAPTNQTRMPRGIAEHPVLLAWPGYGVKFWPDAERYSLRSNARAYVLLKQLEQLTNRFAVPAAWKFIAESRELESWFKNYVLPTAQRTGVIPRGLFQIQDINHETTALGAERWTATEDWLSFIEAAHVMGFSPALTHSWLENLARVHGVTVNGVWGLDWTLPLLRPDAISTDLTAEFCRIAQLIGYEAAENYARQSLIALKGGGTFPAAATEPLPDVPILTGHGTDIYPVTHQRRWPVTFGVHQQLLAAPWPETGLSNLLTMPVEQFAAEDTERTRFTKFIDWLLWQRADLTVLIVLTALFYLSILATSIFWWRFRALRRREPAVPVSTQLVPDATMQRAEERWAKRILGVQVPKDAEHTRFSNAAVEQNFLMQLRAIYKLVLEWRRQENEWTEDDARIAEDESDDWLNGLDEFASLIGIYMRWVIKAGTKDGFEQKDVMTENEDSNHIWARLVMYLSEYYWALLSVMINYSNLVTYQDKAALYGEITQLLKSIGIRQRATPFDARKLLNYPANPLAMDLLIIQKLGMTLSKVMLDASIKLKIPYPHIVSVIEKYKAFKKREHPYPIHPYLIEFAKVVPHFFLMGLGALVWYNQSIGDSPIVPYLWSQITRFAFDADSLNWGLPLLGGLIATVLGSFVRTYRFEGSMLARSKAGLFLDATVTSLFVKKHATLPQVKPGWWWNPELYETTSWVLRAVGFLWLGIVLLRLETPSFATFLIVKGLLAMLAFAEVAGIILPLILSWLSKFLQDRVIQNPKAWKVTHFFNRLNLTATRPASPLWLSIKYHNQPSVPSAGFWEMLQAIVFYFVMAGTFFFVGAYLCQQIFSLWFTDVYLRAAHWQLFIGGLLFWNTMYLLRYGLFLMFTGAASFLATFPIKGSVAFLAFASLSLSLFGERARAILQTYPAPLFIFAAVAIVVSLYEEAILRWLKGRRAAMRSGNSSTTGTQQTLERIKREGSATLGVVYMSGDDLAYTKLTPALLMTRWTLLRDKLDSGGLRLLGGLVDRPDDATVEAWFKALYDAEKKVETTLWNPIQLALMGETPRLRPDLGLNLMVADEMQRQQLLKAWHIRRWLVTMMSTAGHSQDTAISLVDIALRLQREGLAAHTAFYLIQNKYDNNDNNRPVQTPYDKGELGQRNKLARLLTELAPGTRAYSVQNWTPFGFKAGGLTGMDLVHEESLKLTTMLVLDRNANVHDLDALMEDLKQALTDPNIIIIIPGRGTTNTLTPLGQASQMVEEGHRSFLKGLMAWLGGRASESVGTGWGNILAVFYGRVQRAMIDSSTPKMPLTSRMRRGSSFAVRAEGLIGFAPHAVGISEDTWAVSQTTHNAVSFGHRVKFLLSRAMWHKIRETWSHSEWLASFPRWSGGFLQMMHDPIMQRINDFGPASVFAKEVRANSGRNFLSAPFALLNILLMPLAIMLDVTPFVQILIVLWNFGFVMNQILTVHGLNTYLESCGFYRVSAIFGAALAGLGAYLIPQFDAYTPGLLVLGFLAGGFLVGLGRWLYTRVRDVILFGPQLVLHTLGQVLRQTMEFTVSGASPEDAKGVNMSFRAWAGPREDRPLDTFPHFINLKTIVWVVGLLSVILNLFALYNLDMLNVLLLLPSLLFSVSTLVGPFVLRPKVGAPVGARILLPRVLGWAVSFLFYTTVSIFIAKGRGFAWLGTVLFFGVFALLFQRGARYLGFRWRLRRATNELTQALTTAGLLAPEARRLADKISAIASDTAKVQSALSETTLVPEQHAMISKIVEEKMAPHLRTPALALQRGRLGHNRIVSEFNRSLVLSLFILIWFFIVPVPGLFVFTAGPYRFSLRLGTILMFVLLGIAAVLLASWLGKLIQWLHRRGLRGNGLQSRIEGAFRLFQSLRQRPGRLADSEISHIYALFTDVKTYVDQRSYQYATRTVRLIEEKLK